MCHAPDQAARGTTDPGDAGAGVRARPTRVRLLLTILLAAAVIQTPEDACGLTSSSPVGSDGWRAPFDPLSADGASRRRAATTTRAGRADRTTPSTHAVPQQGVRLSSGDVTHYPASVPFHAPDALRTIFLDFATPDWERELSSRDRTGEDLPATLTIDGQAYHEVIPYDFNEALGAGGGRRGGSSSGPHLDPLTGIDDPSRPLRSRLLTLPGLRARYLDYVADIARNWLDWRALEPTVRRYQALIEADVRADGRKLYSLDAFNPEGLRRFVEARRI